MSVFTVLGAVIFNVLVDNNEIKHNKTSIVLHKPQTSGSSSKTKIFELSK